MFSTVCNYIVSFLFSHFKPRVLFSKTFSKALNPNRREDGSLGYDLYSPTKFELKPGERKVIDTGIVFEFPWYLGMFIWDKSSVALKRNLTVCGGVVDPGYRGSIGVILQNNSNDKVVLSKGSAIAQAVFHLALLPTLTEVNKTQLSETIRGERGFGGDSKWNVSSKSWLLD